MNSLFPIEPVFPPGFSYVSDFITGAEEQQLLDTISHIELSTFVFQGFEAKRKFASFGFDYNFDKKSLLPSRPIPDAFQWLISKVAHHLKLDSAAVAELLVLEYPAGAVINWHRDAPPFDIIAGISLLSDCTFKIRPHEKAKQNRKSVQSFPVARRSMYAMQREARSDWQHSTAPVPSLRYSITLRTLREDQLRAANDNL